jgi:hypothetical protein
MPIGNVETQIITAAFPRAGIVARTRFLAHRFPVASSLAIGLFAGAGGMLCFAMLAGVAMEGRAGLMLIYSALNLSVACMLAVWLLASARRATNGDITAALAAATDDERPHLIARLQARLSSRIQTEPLSASQLAAIFNTVRSEHGLPARRRGPADDDQKRLAEGAAGA